MTLRPSWPPCRPVSSQNVRPGRRVPGDRYFKDKVLNCILFFHLESAYSVHANSRPHRWASMFWAQQEKLCSHFAPLPRVALALLQPTVPFADPRACLLSGIRTRLRYKQWNLSQQIWSLADVLFLCVLCICHRKRASPSIFVGGSGLGLG